MVLRPKPNPPPLKLRVPPPPPSMVVQAAKGEATFVVATPSSSDTSENAPTAAEGVSGVHDDVAHHETIAPDETGETGDAPIQKPVSPVLPVSAAEAPEDFADDVYTPAPKSNPVVDALVANGLYLEAEGDGRHRLTCPWASEHPSEVSSQASYQEPTFGRPIGQFRCSHKHSENRDAQSLIDHLGITPEAARAKAVIYMRPGETYRAVDAAERVLAADVTCFDARGPIIRIVTRPGQDISTELVSDQTLSAMLAPKVDFYKPVKGNGWERCDPPASVIQGLRYGQDRLHLKTLSGLSRQPFYGANGQLVFKSGYDEATGIYAAFDEADYDLRNPTREEAERQIDYLKWLMRDFPFASDADRSAAISAIITAVVRPSLPLAPAFNINAPRSGAGKSFLASLVSLAASSGNPHSVSYPTAAEEATKVMLAVLLEKPAIVLFDDMQAQTGWKSLGPINKVLTSPTITERVLGGSRTATARTNVLFLGTGNNVEPAQDMRRRVVSIRLAPKTDAPALQRHTFNPVAHIRKHRSHIVQAALTIVEAHRNAGQPLADVPSIGSYEEWSLLCRQPLIWLGEPDPATSLIEQVQQDDDQGALEEFLKLWFNLFDGEPMMVREVIPEALRSAKFKDVLDEIGVMDGGVVNTKRLGWYLKNNRGRWAGGLQIASGPNSQRNTWRVVRARP